MPLPFRQFLTTRFGKGSESGNFQTEMGGKFEPKSVVNLLRNLQLADGLEVGTIEQLDPQ